MIWSIPAKTFFLGEYAVTTGAPGIVLTTSPYFTLSLSNNPGLHGIHPESPAGKWWRDHGDPSIGLQWSDPYKGLGGLGASSAQFIGSYLATTHLQQQTTTPDDLLAAYWNYAWQGQGLKPSGYDVLAQLHNRCVYLNRQNRTQAIFSWPFHDINFFLIHTGEKLATHLYLQKTQLKKEINALIPLVERAKSAFEQIDSNALVESVNAFQAQLLTMDLVATSTIAKITVLNKIPGVLAIKGCGALGADVILILAQTTYQHSLRERLVTMGFNLLATEADLYTDTSIFSQFLANC